MPFSVPKDVPSFSNPSRSADERLWAASGGMTARRSGLGSGGQHLLHDVQDRVGGFFGGSNRGATLPMYKDKPYAHGTSRQTRTARACKGFIGFAIVMLLVVIYLLGALGKKPATALGLGDLSWLNGPGRGSSRGDTTDWKERRQRVVEAFELSWDAYERNAWGYDEYHPVSETRKNMSPKGLGWVVIGSLDTLMLMNLTSRLTRARKWIGKSLSWDQDQDVNTSETTVRLLGGLLSAHYLSTEFPGVSGDGDDDLYLEKAKDLADRLTGAFESPSGVPFARLHLGESRGIPSHADNGASSTAEAATVQLEFRYLAKLTGERDFWDKAEKVMPVVDNNGAKDGLVPVLIDPSTGEFRGGPSIGLGSSGSASYYEYLIKQYLQTNNQEPVYEEMWAEALNGVRKHLVTYTSPSGFTIVGERPDGLGGQLSPRMDHRVCFMPGTMALAATGGLAEAEAKKLAGWTQQKADDMQLARELMHTCWATYRHMATGLAAETTHFGLPTPPPRYAAPHPDPPAEFDPDPAAAWRQDMTVKPADVQNLQRPETVESLLYMWRITGESKYRDWGWEMFKSFMNHTAVKDGGGFTSLADASVIPPAVKDSMDGSWLAETLKYFYLLFSPNDLLPLDQIVFNTGAHPLPRFPLGQLFSTGWKRTPRGHKKEK